MRARLQPIRSLLRRPEDRTPRAATMKQTSMTRRSFVYSATAGAFLVAFSSCEPGDSSASDRERESLERLTRALYPHDDVTDAVYAEVIESIRRQATDDTALAAALQDGVGALDRASGGDWRSAAAADQIEALAQIEDEPFFTMIQVAIRDQLYEHPEIWRAVGYPGSSVEHGGYINRGFDDIDWLPEA